MISSPLMVSLLVQLEAIAPLAAARSAAHHATRTPMMLLLTDCTVQGTPSATLALARLHPCLHVQCASSGVVTECCPAAHKVNTLRTQCLHMLAQNAQRDPFF